MPVEPEALDLLRRLTGDPAASFRPGQLDAIERLVEQRGRTLVVQRTGWGKSAAYFIATRLLRDTGAGPTVLVSPLLALMRNQLEAAARAGVVAVTINSANQDDWAEIEARISAGEVDLLLISPERLQNDRFRATVLPDLLVEVGMLVVDEAHCISDWGHDFRPDYRRIAQILHEIPATVPVLCTTATANDRVIADIVEQLGHTLEVLRGTLERSSLRLAVVELRAPAERLAWLATVIPDLPGSGIVYCLTIHDTRRVAGWLRTQGIDAAAYSGDDPPEERIELEDALLTNRIKVLVATSALGMGFDKPDLGFVIHYQSPGSPIAYYQQVGRAGRAVDEAFGVLLCGSEDSDIQDHFISTAFPEREPAEGVIALLASAPEPLSIAEIEASVNVRRGRLMLLLKVLEVDGAVERAGGRWRRTDVPWTYDVERVRRVTDHRRAEQAAMVAYAASTRCRMGDLRAQLDDPTLSRAVGAMHAPGSRGTSSCLSPSLPKRSTTCAAAIRSSSRACVGRAAVRRCPRAPSRLRSASNLVVCCACTATEDGATWCGRRGCPDGPHRRSCSMRPRRPSTGGVLLRRRTGSPSCHRARAR
jgi:ATP-dependent DNA helicase RecQ